MKLSYFFAVIAFAAGAVSIQAQTPINTIPQGMIAVPLTKGKTTYFSLPLEATAAYTGAVSSLPSSNTIMIGDSPAPWTANQFATTSQPYFVKFLSGAQSGRILFIQSNTTNTLTLDTTDNAGTTEPLTGNTDSVMASATTFNVAGGDTFEVFPGETLGSVFGDNVNNSDGSTNPLVLTKGTSVSRADTVALLSTTTSAELTYFFDSATNINYWVQYNGPSNSDGTPMNANATRINPYASVAVTVQATNPSLSLALLGQVTEVPLLSKTISKTSRFTSTQCASDITLSQLNFGPNFATNSIVSKADTVGVYNASENPPRFDVYYEDGTATWHKYPDSVTSCNTNTIPVGSCVIITQNSTVHGAGSFLLSSLPYTNN